MSDLNLPLIQAHHPASFAERGVAAPFTTPMLAGARVRPGQNRMTEFVLPNPSGGRGVYIVAWPGVRQFCRPTVHDTLLQERLANLPDLSPVIMRHIARQLAAEGYAGQSAIQAASVAESQEQVAIEDSKQLLLGALADQCLPGQFRVPSSMADADRRARQVILTVSARLGCAPEVVGRILTALARSLAAVGLESDLDTPRLAGLLNRMNRLRQSVTTWAEAGHCANSLAQDVAGSVHITLACAETLIRGTRALTADMLSLLRRWLAAPADTLHQVERLDWLVDGWERLCLLWETGDQASYRRVALMEIAQLVPVLPPEVQSWVGLQLHPGAFQPGWRVVSMDDGWRSGSAAFGLVARNERLRALSV